ncbi:MAG TPA: RHS repeat-associated core domain-containing protein [Treponemataceae bacterium]|nr:RHS repeat-associated core domain-containing protein [Treponemataceae bacterium]
MPCVSLQRKSSRFQEETSDIEMQLLKLGLFFEDSIYFNSSAMRNYTREWQYDSVGNILSLIHNANGNAWTRSYDYASDSNRVNSTTVGQTTVNYTYNAHGSMTSMPHLQGMQWDFAEKLSHITRGTTEAYYNYDGGGQRIRKVVEKGIVETRLYLGGFEIWRKTVNGVLNTERETLHVMDDQKRIALVETLTIDNGTNVAYPLPVQRYQFDNHLGSASLELDDLANVISYEEYYPYGDTSYQAGRSASEVSQKRYRYTGKEKDEESGLYYHGARYYACWLGRWTAADPIGLVDGVNLYVYVRGNPVRLSDPSGKAGVMVLDEVEVKGQGPKQSSSSSSSSSSSASSATNSKSSSTAPTKETSFDYGGYSFKTKELRDQFQTFVENKFNEEVIVANGFDIPLPSYSDEPGQDVLRNRAVGERLESSRDDAFAQKTQEWLEKSHQGLWKEARRLQGLPRDPEAYMWYMAGKQSRAMVAEGTKQLMYGALMEATGAGLGALGLRLLNRTLNKPFNPFKGKTPAEIDKMFRTKGLEPVGPDPLSGLGGYKNLESGTSYHIDLGGTYKKGTELPHVDVNRPKGSSLPKRKFPLGDNLYE